MGDSPQRGVSRTSYFKKKKKEEKSFFFQCFKFWGEFFRMVRLVKVTFSRNLWGLWVKGLDRAPAWEMDLTQREARPALKREAENNMNRACSKWSGTMQEDKGPISTGPAFFWSFLKVVKRILPYSRGAGGEEESLFVLLRPSTDWMRSIYIREGKLLYIVYRFKCWSHLETPSKTDPEQCFTKCLGTQWCSQTDTVN